MPEDEAMAERAGTREKSPTDSVRFRAQLQGWLEVPFRQAAVRLDLTATMSGWKAFQTDPHHRLQVEGTVDIDRLATARPVTGTIAVFPDDGRASMEYSLDFTDDKGAASTLRGVVTQRQGNPRALWYDLTTVRVELTPSGGGRPIPGLRRVPPRQVLRLLASLRSDGDSVPSRAGALARYGLHLGSGAVKAMLSRSGSTRR